jgi:hypothetical protein
MMKSQALTLLRRVIYDLQRNKWDIKTDDVEDALDRLRQLSRLIEQNWQLWPRIVPEKDYTYANTTASRKIPHINPGHSRR